jgi:hypothetical protein
MIIYLFYDCLNGDIFVTVIVRGNGHQKMEIFFVRNSRFRYVVLINSSYIVFGDGKYSWKISQVRSEAHSEARSKATYN